MFDLDIQLAYPVIAPAVLGLVLLVLVRAVRGSRWALPSITLIGFGLTGVVLARLAQYISVEGPQVTANGMITIDGFGLFFSAVVLAITVKVAISNTTAEKNNPKPSMVIIPLAVTCGPSTLMYCARRARITPVRPKPMSVIDGRLAAFFASFMWPLGEGPAKPATARE